MIKWDKQRVYEAAAKCKNASEFKKKFSGAIKYAIRHNIYKEIALGFEPKIKWDDKSVRKFALSCKTLSEFMKKATAYKYSRKHGIYDEVTSHMAKNTKWTDELVREAALKHNRRIDFITKDPGAVEYAKRNGFYKDICSHMNEKKKTWNYEEVKILALKCETRWEFQQKYRDAYRSAICQKNLDEICSHMRIVGNKNKRKIYEIRFPNIKSCYIGLTHDTKERRLAHEKSSSNKNVANLINSGEKYEWFEGSDWYDEDIIGKIENERIKIRKNEGWTILNVVKGGALGSFSKLKGKQLEEKILKVKEIALKCESFKRFRKDFGKEYAFAKKIGILEEVTKHFKKKIVWTYENSKIEALKYSSRYELQLGCKSAYNYLKKQKLLDTFFPNKPKSWSHETVRELALKYNRREEFVKNGDGAAHYAKRHGIYNEITSHMPNRSKRRWGKKP